MNMYNQRTDFFGYYRNIQEQARGDILRESEAQILGTDADELAQYYYEKYALSPIVEDTAAQANFDIQDYLQDVPARRRDPFHQDLGTLHNMPAQRAVVEVPIIPNKDLETIASLQTSTYTSGYSDRDFRWNTNSVSMSIETKGYQFELDQNQIALEIKKALESIRQTISWKNSDIQKGNRELLEHIKSVINDRKQSILQNKEKIATLTKTISIPLKQKESLATQTVRIKQSPLVQRVKPKPTLPEEYVIDEVKVNDVITMLDNQARNYEQTPRAVKELGEEDLRDLLLANLNSVFEGNATGETFSKKGKTDIYLKINKGNILICECKIWGGRNLYQETIDQLRGYLTWRHNYGILITFVRLKDFTKALRESESAIMAHPSYINGFRKINDSHFVSNHGVDDAEKVVKLHHLFYHIYFGSHD